MKWIALTQGYFTKVDDEDFVELNKHRWHVTRSAYNWYASRWVCRKKIYMHRQIAKPTNGQVVNHIDGDSLNNTRANLECCDQTENMRKRRWV